MELIPNRFQAETNPLVFCATGCVARSLQTAAGMRLTRALPVSQNPARLSLSLKAHWNKSDVRTVPQLQRSGMFIEKRGKSF